MRTMLLATAAALAVIATPAAARDNSGYVGVEAGLLFPKDTNLDVTVDGTDVFDKAFTVNHKTGWDGDLIGGYDFGMFRVEGELGYKRAKNDSFDIDPLLLDAIEADLGSPITAADLELDGRTSVVSGMLNAMLDFGGNTGVGAYVGGGIGVAGVKFSAGGESDRDSGLAWQFLAGIRAPVSPNIDVGLKYRYFQTKKLNFDTAFDTVDTGLSGRFKSHSLLASLVYNFGAPVAVAPPPPPPPPPPPEAPATQTCPDGSVVLATSSCPLPPPPPPPPPPSSGERGR